MRKIKKLVATLLAATMVMAMGVTAFAADSLYVCKASCCTQKCSSLF